MQSNRYCEGWRGATLVAITYVYFLIFAQFAFLKYLAGLGIEGGYLKFVMGAMAVGGILASLFSVPLGAGWPAHYTLRTAFSGCAVAAALIWQRLNLAESLAVAFLIGISLGLLTVTLVAHLRAWIGASHSLFKVGLGTGLGYLVCNFPPLFTASARTQAGVAAALCLLGIGITNCQPAEASDEVATVSPSGAPPFLFVLACFTALVWLDSAAFFIIQNTPQLKAGTWEGRIHLWVNGCLHLGAALAGGWLLYRRGLMVTLVAAFGFLACACLLLYDPGHAMLASGLYPIGVSLYSVALVAYPGFLAGVPSVAQRGRRAGLIYAIAGWVGSALGIGMGQNLGHIPPAFVLAASALLVSPWLWQIFKQRRRESVVTVTLLALAFGVQELASVHHARQQRAQADSLIALGRQTYINEGCINCHSQYVRPNSNDVLMWGPTLPLEAVRHERPPLIGNRRQGPDLAEVGARRSALWLKVHFITPAAVSYASFMPSYGYLFRDSRGDAVVAYLESLGSPSERKQRAQMAEGWSPSPKAVALAKQMNGAALFQHHCGTCHQATGATQIAWRKDFPRLPPNLASDPLFFVPASSYRAKRWTRLSEIVKFGLPGTDMPGHEYLSDAQVIAITDWVNAAAKGRERAGKVAESH